MSAEVRDMKLIVTLERDETGMIVAECPAIPGCISQGCTEEEALANIREAIQVCVEARAASGMPITVATREVEVDVTVQTAHQRLAVESRAAREASGVLDFMLDDPILDDYTGISMRRSRLRQRKP